MTLYFPDGRRPGASVIVEMHDHLGNSVSSTYALDDNGGAVDIEAWGFELGVTGLQETSLEGELIGPDDGVVARVARNLSADDVFVEGVAEMTLCPSSSALPSPEPFWSSHGPSVGPLAELSPSIPVPVADLDRYRSALQVTDDEGNAISLELDVPQANDAVQWSLRAHSAFPPGATLTFSAPGQSDVLGRPLLPLPSRTVLSTSATVTDLQFSTEPPAAAIVATRDDDFDDVTVGWQEGQLVIGAAYGDSSYSVLIGLPEPGDVTQARVRALVTRCSSLPRELSFGLVRANGAASRFEVPCGDEMQDVVVELPAGVGPLWLDVESQHTWYPQSNPGGVSEQLVLDEIEYLP